MRRIGAIGLAVAALLLVAGCGSSDSDGGGDTTTTTSASTTTVAEGTTAPPKALTKAAYVKQANAICKKAQDKLSARAEELDLDNAEKSVIVQYVAEDFLPSATQQILDIRALGYPEGDEEKLATIYDELDEKIAEVAQDPESFVDSPDDPFAAQNEALTDYGIDVCGS